MRVRRGKADVVRGTSGGRPAGIGRLRPAVDHAGVVVLVRETVPVRDGDGGRVRVPVRGQDVPRAGGRRRRREGGHRAAGHPGAGVLEAARGVRADGAGVRRGRADVARRVHARRLRRVRRLAAGLRRGRVRPASGVTTAPFGKVRFHPAPSVPGPDVADNGQVVYNPGGGHAVITFLHKTLLIICSE